MEKNQCALRWINDSANIARKRAIKLDDNAIILDGPKEENQRGAPRPKGKGEAHDDFGTGCAGLQA
jgi:hypothetical protein